MFGLQVFGQEMVQEDKYMFITKDHNKILIDLCLNNRIYTCLFTQHIFFLSSPNHTVSSSFIHTQNVLPSFSPKNMCAPS